jgi:PAS domain S-box-containing protein
VIPDAFIDAGETDEELFDHAPCGYLSTSWDGHILRVNATLERWLDIDRTTLTQLLFRDLLTAGGRLYHETHFAPLLQIQGRVREIALDLRRADGTLLPALINSVLSTDARDGSAVIRTIVFDATERRSYERELLRTSAREHAVADELQLSLLAGEMPEDERLEIAVVYRPAVVGLRVGGDWYDAFWLDEGRELAIVVGDVVGRGVSAAAAMGQLRSAVRALAGTGPSPAAVLEGLEAYVRRHGVGDMATVAYAQLDLERRVLRFACAGHPPPAIVEPGRAPYLSWAGRSTPLAALMTLELRQEGVVSLPAGAVVLFFSDGAFERRDRPIDAGLAELLDEADARRFAPMRDLADGLARAMTGNAAAEDDLCLVAFRLS